MSRLPLLHVSLVTALAACGGSSTPAPSDEAVPAALDEAAPATPDGAAADAAEGDGAAKAGKGKGKGKAPLVLPDADTVDVVLVILDTVRADHTSLCGYARPTTPFLAKLVADFHGTFTCDGRSPGAWTLPTHATWFTGVLLPEHHYDSMNVPDWSQTPTLADRMAAKGYDTVLVTANPVLTRARGLDKGYRIVRSAEEIDEWRREVVVDEVRTALQDADLDKPLFLTVNIMDAHDPYPAVPDGLDWVQKRKAMDFKVKDRDHEHPYHRFLKGEMDADGERKFLAALTDGYDYGISQADTTLKEVLGVLARRGRVGHGLRLVVAADHGEFLGEHHLLRHGGWLWEPVVTVPMVVVDTREGHAAPPLPTGPLSSAHVFDLVLTGELPTTLRDAVAFSSASNFAENPGVNSVAMWSADADKLVWTKDGVVRYDLPADPAEEHPKPVTADPMMSTLQGHVAGYKTQVAWRESQHASAEDLAALEALGYVEKAAQ
ncbi:MAG: sulfatase-like hydrolase/transferase [Alphaproteobacteria bacterium]|nr:sulfatase-like hydrolase/transferase [Alphaproteobacteria bacterium]